MKNLFFVAVIITGFTVTSFTTIAQTSVNLEKVTGNSKPVISLKFIEGIEISPEVISEKTSTSKEITPISINENTSNLNLVGGDIEKCSATQFKYAMLMNKEVEMLTNTSLYNFIDEWWGTRYHYGGSDKSGIDCSSFSGKLMGQIYNISLPRTSTEQYQLTEKIATENLVEGDLVFFGTHHNISHVGVYLGNNYFVHSSVHLGVVISSLTEDYYNRKFVGGGRVSK